jgi:hypothetical protein
MEKLVSIQKEKFSRLTLQPLVLELPIAYCKLDTEDLGLAKA